MPEKRSSQILIFSLIVTLSAQININLFSSNFKISIGIIMCSVFLLLLGEYDIVPIAFLSAAGVFISRIGGYWFDSGSPLTSTKDAFPEMIFYLTYGIIFWLYFKRKHFEWNVSCFPFLFVFDYISNLMELILRPGIGIFSLKSQLTILLVAAFRTVTILLIYLVLRYYKFNLLKKEHSQRYQRLLLLISKLNGEVLWMQKNTGLIETTMNTSYRLYQQMQELGMDEELSKQALNVAKDIHEIKKEYFLILRGLSEAMDLNLDDEGMYLQDILHVLKNTLSASMAENHRSLVMDINLEENLYTENHYFLMSIFRNLFTNAIEASKNSTVTLQVTQTTAKDGCHFIVTDDGPGISSEHLNQIFQPGFSTKINYDTGEINRGLGLNLVQDIITNQWNGTIYAESHPGKTSFFFFIPREQWKEYKNETVHS